jgi:hypothetical protein
MAYEIHVNSASYLSLVILKGNASLTGKEIQKGVASCCTGAILMRNSSFWDYEIHFLVASQNLHEIQKEYVSYECEGSCSACG